MGRTPSTTWRPLHMDCSPFAPLAPLHAAPLPIRRHSSKGVISDGPLHMNRDLFAPLATLPPLCTRLRCSFPCSIMGDAPPQRRTAVAASRSDHAPVSPCANSSHAIRSGKMNMHFHKLKDSPCLHTPSRKCSVCGKNNKACSLSKKPASYYHDSSCVAQFLLSRSLLTLLHHCQDHVKHKTTIRTGGK